MPRGWTFWILASWMLTILGSPAQGWAQPAADRGPVGHPSWLAQVQQAPLEQPERTMLSPLLRQADGTPITTQAQWQTRREQLLEAWRGVLRPLNFDPLQVPKVTLLDEAIVEGIVRQRIAYEAEPGQRVEAYLLKPAERGIRRPGVVVLHSTVNHSIAQPAGLGPDPEKAFGLKLARRGMVTLSPRNFLWPTNEGIAARGEAEAFLERRPESTGMARMLFDAQLAVTLLAADPDVDPRRIGCVGHSLGAKEVLYLMAFDDRVQVGVSSEGGIGVAFSNWEAPWYLGTQVQSPGFEREHHELLAMIAPRPFLLIGGESADGDASWPFIASVLPVYRLYSSPPAVGLFNHRQGHVVPPEAERRIEEWLATYLSGTPSGS